MMDGEWVKVCTRDELLPGEFKVVWDGDTAIAVYNLEGDLYAVEDTCRRLRLAMQAGEISAYRADYVDRKRVPIQTVEVTKNDCP